MCYIIYFFYYLIPACCILTFLLLFCLFYNCLSLYLLHFYLFAATSTIFYFSTVFSSSMFVSICLFSSALSYCLFPISIYDSYDSTIPDSQIRTFSVSGGGMEYGVIGTSDQSDTKDGLEELCPVCGDKARLLFHTLYSPTIIMGRHFGKLGISVETLCWVPVRSYTYDLLSTSTTLFGAYYDYLFCVVGYSSLLGAGLRIRIHFIRAGSGSSILG